MVGTFHEGESSPGSYWLDQTSHKPILGLQIDKFGKVSQLTVPGIHRTGNVTKQLKVWTHKPVLAVVFSRLENYSSEIREGN